MDFGNASRATHQDNLINFFLCQLCIFQSLLNRSQSCTEKVSIFFFKLCTAEWLIEIDALIKRVYFNIGLMTWREGPLGSFTRSSQPSHGSLVARDIFLIFLLEFFLEVINHTIVKVLTSQMGITTGWLHFKDAIINCKNRHIKGTSTKIKDENMTLCVFGSILVQTIGNGGSSWLIDYAKNIKASNDSYKS